MNKALSLLLAGLVGFVCSGVAFSQARPEAERNLTTSATLAKNPEASAEPRFALIIGNSAYKEGALANPVNDARDVAKTLAGLGFTVTLRENASLREMKQAIREFALRIKDGGVGLFYFAGHGIQSRGRNYLVPVNAEITQEFEVEDQTVDANLILGAMDEAKNRVNILVLDACRNNPFARSFRSSASGLAQMDAARGTLIAYATSPGSVAADGTGRNGTYTKHLLQSLQQGDSDIGRVFSRVRAGVVQETGGRQTPWESTSLIGDFYFNPAQRPDQASTVPGPAAAVSPLALEIAYWESIQQSRSKADFDAYLARYPAGQFSELARNRLIALARPDPSAPSEGRKTGPPATFTFYRPSALAGWGADTLVTIQGREVGQLPQSSFVTVQVSPGPQNVVAETGSWITQRVFDVEPGQKYYVRVEHSLGLVRLRQVKEAEGKDETQSMRDTTPP